MMVERVKQKALLQTLREKKRYVVFETMSENSFNFKELKDAVFSSFKDLFGLDGLAKAGLEFVEYEQKKGIIRVSSKGVDQLRASFCFLRKINKDEVIVRSLGVSGILKKAKFKF